MAYNFYDAANWLSGQLGGKKSDGKWRMAPCPAHDDRKPSLAIGAFDGGVYASCKAGCTFAAVSDALTARGLLPIPFNNFLISPPSFNAPPIPQEIDPAIPRQKTDAERIAGAHAIWDAASPLDVDDPDDAACLYLQRRAIAAFAGSPELRFHRCCKHIDGAQYRALVCRVLDVRGRFMGVHIVYLRRDGSKALIEPAKASWGPVRGGAVRIGGMAREIVIGEGVETSIAAGLQLNLPPWAALSSGNLERVVLPEAIRSIVIAADHDAAGIKAAEAAYRRWTGQGRAVRIVKPNAYKADFADVLAGRCTSEIV